MRPAEFLRQLWSGHRLMLSAIVLLLLVNLLLALFLQYYFAPAVNAREQELIQLQTELRGGSGDSPAALFAQGEKDLKAFRERIPARQEFTGLLVELQTVAEDAGLELGQITYQHDQDKENGLLRYRLSFTLVGGYRDIKRFVHALEQSPRLVAINQISLQGVGEDDETDVRLQLNLETYFRTGAS